MCVRLAYEREVLISLAANVNGIYDDTMLFLGVITTVIWFFYEGLSLKEVGKNVILLRTTHQFY